MVQKGSMAKREYHNLDGVLRDLIRAVDDEGGAGWERLLHFVRIIADILDILDDVDPGVEDAEEPAGPKSQLDLGLRDGVDRPSVGGTPPGHGPDGSPHVVGSAGLGASMEHRVRDLARAGARGTAQPVAGPQLVVKPSPRWGGP